MPIRDNSNAPEWPERVVTFTTDKANTLDDQPYAQYVLLDCGHWLINTFGRVFPECRVGQTLRCRTCGLLSPQPRTARSSRPKNKAPAGKGSMGMAGTLPSVPNGETSGHL